jgi:site-specific DNA-methyltransferase (adenine-specific)
MSLTFDQSSTSSFVIAGDNLGIIRELPSSTFQLIYIDPPFNTGRIQKRETLRTTRSQNGTRLGFKGQNYSTIKVKVNSYDDSFEDYWNFLEPRLEEAWRLLTPTGTLYLHLDYREVHYAKVLLDALFGRECFLNEIIWAYDYGARSKSKWPTKHDNILVYVKDPENYYFDAETVDREPYMAPGLVTPEKVARGKLPTDVWWHTIVPTNGKEKTGYPTQKPEGILRRIVAASSKPGDWVLDFFAGSGTTGKVALDGNRRFVMVDQNPEAIETMQKRFGFGNLNSRIEFLALESVGEEK